MSSTKGSIHGYLEVLSFVQWDRWSGDSLDDCTIFGWIERNKPHSDGVSMYKDFVVIDFENGEPTLFRTSSATYSKKIADILNFDHSDCKRVENNFDIENVLKLKVRN